ncbi:hypothetical protein HG530_003894 [Fusarium avenaceum]|nr:hypothetical protein HG530_003894 [Fusarium avenaceum]
MLTQSLSRAAAITALCLANLAIAAIPSASTRTTESTSITTRRPNERPSARPDDKVMAACGGHISECGVHDKAKIIYIPISTVTVTNEIVTTSITTLPPQINYITEVKVETVNNKTQGHCRDTVTLDGDIVTVKVDINVVAVEESQGYGQGVVGNYDEPSPLSPVIKFGSNIVSITIDDTLSQASRFIYEKCFTKLNETPAKILATKDSKASTDIVAFHDDKRRWVAFQIWCEGEDDEETESHIQGQGRNIYWSSAEIVKGGLRFSRPTDLEQKTKLDCRSSLALLPDANGIVLFGIKKGGGDS